MILDQGTGFDLLDQIDYAHLHITICTAHDEFALKAIQYEVVDYLLKPIEIQDLQQTIVKIKNKQNKRVSKYMMRKQFQSFHLMPMNLTSQ